MKPKETPTDHVSVCLIELPAISGYWTPLEMMKADGSCLHL